LVEEEAKETKEEVKEVVIKQKEEQHQNSQKNQINLNILRIRGGEGKKWIEKSQSPILLLQKIW
jgi:hypothetical protein